MKYGYGCLFIFSDVDRANDYRQEEFLFFLILFLFHFPAVYPIANTQNKHYMKMSGCRHWNDRKLQMIINETSTPGIFKKKMKWKQQCFHRQIINSLKLTRSNFDFSLPLYLLIFVGLDPFFVLAVARASIFVRLSLSRQLCPFADCFFYQNGMFLYVQRWSCSSFASFYIFFPSTWKKSWKYDALIVFILAN